ncbi:MAG: hypothetical protein GY928_05750 [Colwellia sp.]|nr:hypothetical protein [Colwellia sp.]
MTNNQMKIAAVVECIISHKANGAIKQVNEMNKNFLLSRLSKSRWFLLRP